RFDATLPDSSWIIEFLGANDGETGLPEFVGGEARARQKAEVALSEQTLDGHRWEHGHRSVARTRAGHILFELAIRLIEQRRQIPNRMRSATTAGSLRKERASSREQRRRAHQAGEAERVTAYIAHAAEGGQHVAREVGAGG